jgi:hypothetical protein
MASAFLFFLQQKRLLRPKTRTVHEPSSRLPGASTPKTLLRGTAL